ncbi:basement membrane-specific heparan sulfate proteoglycan core protein-like [Fundulus diaphanus]
MRKFLLSCLLLLCARLSWSVSSDLLVVTQSPDVSFQEGATGNISCCWKGKAIRVGVQWLKNQISIKHETFIHQSTASQTERAISCSVLTFPNFTISDSGKYICKITVEIPTLAVVEGNGTTIRVTAADPNILNGVSSDLLVVTQSPDVSFQEGETGNISCCWKGKVQRVRITWFKNQTLIQNKSVINQSTGSQTEQVNSCSVLIFPKFTTKDSGKYICRFTVEIPVLTEVVGNGTTIRVTAAETPSVTTDHHGLNGVSSDLLVVTQSPDVSFQEGETGNISCCWKGKVQRVHINWFKNQTIIQLKTVINQSTGSQTEQVNSCSVLIFPKFKTKDSGK